MTKQPFDLQGRIAVVTGGARGLGQAAAVGLAQHGADVAVIDTDAAECADTASRVVALGRRCTVHACDVADEPQVAATVAGILTEHPRIDILVNIAGITARIPTDRMPPEQVRRLMEVNYYGSYWMCQSVGRHMLERGAGTIINMSALGGGLVGLGRGNAAYCSTKGAIAALTRDLACEWGPRGIRVNALAPGWFETAMNTGIFANPDFVAQIMTKVPSRRIGQPQDLVGPVVFLASDAAAMINGLIMPVDGGAHSTCPITWEHPASSAGPRGQ